MKSKFFKTLPLVLIFLGSMAVVSCKDSKEGETDITAEDTMEMDMTTPESDAHLVAWSGTYEGTLPCADCEGIETTIVVNNDGTYEKTAKYLKGAESQEFQEMGTYNWDENSNVITLKPANDNNPGGSLLYKFENDHIVALNQDGSKVTGDLADHYVLKKQ
ncbi:MAG TPA: copper resistance protein NlpE [Flavobacteriaceae bacterium]|nr:copper resistance protein NlpE [Flavobacteriaceae bacterium]